MGEGQSEDWCLVWAAMLRERYWDCVLAVESWGVGKWMRERAKQRNERKIFNWGEWIANSASRRGISRMLSWGDRKKGKREMKDMQHAPAGCGMGEGRRGNADNHYFLSWYIKLGAKTDSTSLLHTMCSIAWFLCNGKHWRVWFCQAVGGGQKILLLVVGEGGKGLCTQEAFHYYKAEIFFIWTF